MFRSKKRIICPHCIGEVRGEKLKNNCDHCGYELPIQYTTDYEEHQPFFVQVCGWSRVGKTVFLSALTLMLVKMSKIWPKYYCAAATETANQKVREVNEFLVKGTMPGVTQVTEEDVFVMLLKNMELWGSRTLVIRDCPGEIFDNLQIPVDKAPFLLKAPITFMFISLSDLPNSGGRTMNMLLENYINTLMRQGIDFNKERRKLVVVFTKADLIEQLPANLRNYLISDPIWAAVNNPKQVQQKDAIAMQEYLCEMERVSNAIGDWIQLGAPGLNFVRLAESKNIELRFSLISSTGSPLDEQSVMVNTWEPRRVLDPFFWALELQSRAINNEGEQYDSVKTWVKSLAQGLR
ncbi:MAG TPA: GTPase domain-containing protein [Bacillota bacterium]|nr:GTPase domain-containing protein [Bacillota bacterium]